MDKTDKFKIFVYQMGSLGNKCRHRKIFKRVEINLHSLCKQLVQNWNDISSTQGYMIVTKTVSQHPVFVMDLQGTLGLYAHPIYVDGDYPDAVKMAFGSKIPTISDEEKKLIKGGCIYSFVFLWKYFCC